MGNRRTEATAQRATVAVSVALPILTLGIRTACERVGVRIEEWSLEQLRKPPRPVDALVYVLRTEDDWETLETACPDETHPPVLALLPSADNGLAERAFFLGASGVLSFSADSADLVAALEALLHGRAIVPRTVLRTIAMSPRLAPLSTEEVDWLRSLAHGATVSQLAQQAAYSERQVYRRLKCLYGRLGASCKTEALLRAQRAGLLG